MNNPNPVTYYPLTQYTLNSALMTLTDQLTKVDTLRLPARRICGARPLTTC